MTNIKKLGLTALAGSMVATSAYAGALDVTGTAKIVYATQDDDEITGNPFSNNQTIAFGGSGDLDNGMTISYGYTMTNAAFSSSTLKLDMGDAGVLSYADSASSTGLGAYDDVMPTAGEEVWDDLAGGDDGVATINNNGTLGYANTYAGIGVSLSYNPDDNTGTALAPVTGGSSKSIVITSSDLMDGLEVGYGIGTANANEGSQNETDLDTMFAKYTAGSITAGVQLTNIDKAAAASDTERLAYAISMAINENLSASVGVSSVDYEGTSKVDMDHMGFAVSYTMGSMTIAAFQNTEDNSSGTSGTDDKVTEISVAFAF
jgi:outer membrane protein OmpU